MEDYINNIPVGILILGKDRIIKVWNNQLTEMTGVTRDEVLGKRDYVLPVFDVKDSNVIIDFNDCLSDKKVNLFSKTAFLKNKENKETLVFIRAKKLNSKDEKLYIFTFTDISSEISCSNLYTSTFSDPQVRNNIVGQDIKIREVHRMIELAADSEANILIYGESGTGKELVADAIHNLSGRNKQPIIKVNCSALSETLLESELFGHVRGAFTGAIKDKPGKFEEANNGTIFLDEIGEISPLIQ